MLLAGDGAGAVLTSDLGFFKGDENIRFSMVS